jgi:SnoaL-like protein
MLPDAAMMVGPECIARFIETGDGAALAGVFADDVIIIENFAPYVFAGPESVALWLHGMRAHLEGTSGLEHTFGQACDFGRADGAAFFTLPTRWKGLARGRRFQEHGGWAFVLVQTGAQWRVRSYAWAVTGISGI